MFEHRLSEFSGTMIQHRNFRYYGPVLAGCLFLANLRYGGLQVQARIKFCWGRAPEKPTDSTSKLRLRRCTRMRHLTSTPGGLRALSSWPQKLRDLKIL